MLTVPGSAPLGSVMWVWPRPRENGGEVHLGDEGRRGPRVPVGEERGHVVARADEEPFQRVQLGQGLAGGHGDLGLARHTPAWYAESVWGVTEMVGPEEPPGEMG